MYALDGVVLFAMDVVRGPYVHCYAPHNDNDDSTRATATAADGEDNTNDNAAAAEATARDCHAGASHNVVDGVRALGDDVFMPRSEFCRCVLWLHAAESGRLYVYYPEELVGTHYVRKTLRYTLCLVLRVPCALRTMGEQLTRQLLQPLSAVLHSIAAQLREAEGKHAYVSRQLASSTTTTTTTTTMTMTMGDDNDSSSRTPCLNVFVTPPRPHRWRTLQQFVTDVFTCLCDDVCARDTTVPRGGAAMASDADASVATSGSRSSRHSCRRRRRCYSNHQDGILYLSNKLHFHLPRLSPAPVLPVVHDDDVPLRLARSGSDDDDNDDDDDDDDACGDLVVATVLCRVDGRRCVADIVWSLVMHTSLTLGETAARVVATHHALAPQQQQQQQQQHDKTATSAPSSSLLWLQLLPSSATSTATTTTTTTRVLTCMPAALATRAVVTRVALVVCSGDGDVRVLPCRDTSLANNTGSSTCNSTVCCRVWLYEVVAASQAHAREHNNNNNNSEREGVGDGYSGRRAQDRRHAASPLQQQQQQPRGATSYMCVELTDAWHAMAALVTEALLHAVAKGVVRMLRPWRLDALYTTTPALHTVLHTPSHPARAVLARYMLRVTTEQEQERQQRRRSATSTATTAGTTRADGDANARDDASTTTLLRLREAATAALCALSKFTYDSPRRVRAHMRAMPALRHAFACWSHDSCHALTEVALLNDWLREV